MFDNGQFRRVILCENQFFKLLDMLFAVYMRTCHFPHFSVYHISLKSGEMVNFYSNSIKDKASTDAAIAFIFSVSESWRQEIQVDLYRSQEWQDSNECTCRQQHISMSL